MRRWALLSALAAVFAGATAAAMVGDRARAPTKMDQDPPGQPSSSGAPLDWLAASAGATPEFNQVSLEQDLALAASVLGGRGRVLFAAGPDRPVVQVLDSDQLRDPVMGPLADLFSPRSGRTARYRSPRIPVHGLATAHSVTKALREALEGSSDPLLVFLGGHGHPGETPIDNTIGLWASTSISAGELASVLDEYPRPTRFVITTCYSGGFAEMVFSDGAAAMGAAKTDRCGLFASPWDLEASGCDPDPNRAGQEGYALHFFRALVGQDRDGTPLPAGEVDIDADGSISLLEAHARVRIASKAPDVPTSTSERWLRHQFPDGLPPTDPPPGLELPEEARVVQRLTTQLGVQALQAAAHLQQLEDDWVQQDGVLGELRKAEDDAYLAAAADLLARWPVLDDPWHPHFNETIERNRRAILSHLEGSDSYLRYTEARTAVDRQSTVLADLRAKAAPLERLSRAVQTMAMARAVQDRGGFAWDRYQELLGCERWVPQIARP